MNENANNPSFQIHSLSPQINPSLLYLSSNNELETKQNELKLIEENDIEEKYKQEILEQCIANQNEQKEKFIEEKLKQKISQKMKKTLYQDEYKVVYERIKRENSRKSLLIVGNRNKSTKSSCLYALIVSPSSKFLIISTLYFSDNLLL